MGMAVHTVTKTDICSNVSRDKNIYLVSLGVGSVSGTMISFFDLVNGHMYLYITLFVKTAWKVGTSLVTNTST